MIATITHESDYTKKHREEFCKTLSKLINEVVIPKYGMGLTFSIEMGLFTSGEYGSYRIPFKNKGYKRRGLLYNS
jgi:hypothetical protein